ncbi:hypothetical protein LTR36_005196 [Oleoguttula mirabilis]|uniref:RNI-like protein n=1 Tax=Oleoguttula mirabilis TaxID=1507867 RepID=A0AAV9JZ36_9PEZI|nr:hypothetical protein LTR36_005196 [Oleoguttula mirabilis]
MDAPTPAIGATLNLPTETETVDHWTALLRTSLDSAKHGETVDSTNGVVDAEPLDVSEEVLNAPRRKSARDALAHQIAARLHPGHDEGSLAPIIQYEKDLIMLRALIFGQRRTAVARATEGNARLDWVKRISNQGPWNKANALSLEGAPALPMPVEMSDPESLKPFFAHLRNGGTHEPSPSSSTDTHSTTSAEPHYETELIEFEKGVLYADGRVDLCKIVTGPRNIGDLMDSLRTNPFSKHFLLGNNIIGPTGAKAIASFIDEYPDRFETWYLAGNCIDTAGFSTLVDSLVTTKAVTNVWLKRNPLDLDQTLLGDAGVAELFSSLADLNKQLALRHIYLNATGIGEKACTQIARYLAAPNCALHSLYMSNNPVGDAGAAALASGLAANRSLKRLSLQSCSLEDVRTLLEACTNLEMLDIGQSYATEDLGMRYNWLIDTSVPAFVSLVSTSTNLTYFNLSYTPIPRDQLNRVLEAATTSPSLLWFDAKPLVKGGKDVTSVRAGQESVRLWKLLRQRLHDNVTEAYGLDYDGFMAQHKRFLVSPKDVRLIDSVYRNRDAGLARRGLKKLDKWWDEGDDTLRQVQDGTFV